MELELDYEEVQNNINSKTLSLLKEYKIKDTIEFTLPDDQAEITQKIFLEEFDKHINTIVEVLQKQSKILFEKDSLDKLKNKEIQMKKLYDTFTSKNQQLIHIIQSSYSNQASKRINSNSNIKSNKINNSPSTIIKKSELERKNCKKGLESFKNPRENSMIYTKYDSYNKDIEDDNDYILISKNKRGDINRYSPAKTHIKLHENNSTFINDNYYRKTKDNSHYHPMKINTNNSYDPYFLIIIILLYAILILTLYHILTRPTYYFI